MDIPPTYVKTETTIITEQPPIYDSVQRYEGSIKYNKKCCDKVACDKVACDKVACDKVACDKVACCNSYKCCVEPIETQKQSVYFYPTESPYLWTITPEFGTYTQDKKTYNVCCPVYNTSDDTRRFLSLWINPLSLNTHCTDDPCNIFECRCCNKYIYTDKKHYCNPITKLRLLIIFNILLQCILIPMSISGVFDYNPVNAQLNNCTNIYDPTGSDFTINSHCSHTPVYVCIGIMAIFHLFQVLIILPYSCSLDIRYVLINTIVPSSISIIIIILCQLLYNTFLKNLFACIKMCFK